MRTFIFSYVISLIPLSIVFYPTLQVEPIEALTRIFFYLGFPLAIAVSILLIAAQYVLGKEENSNLAYSGIHNAADSAVDAAQKAS